MRINFKKTKLSAVCQIVLGLLCLVFGIFDRIFIYTRYGYPRAFQTEGVIAIWMGVWFLITGVIGYFASKPYPNTQRPKMAMISTYLGFSIVATVFAGVLLICYSVGLHDITRGKSCTRYQNKCNYYPYNCQYVKVTDSKCQTSVGLGAMIIIFAVVEFGVGIWASVCCCMGYDSCCGDTSQPQTQGQVVYLQTQGGAFAAYVMTQGPNGMPVAVPAMTGGPVYPVPNQAVGGQQYMMQQNPQAATPTQYVQGAGGQVYMQNPQGTAIVRPLQQDVATSGDQQPAVKTTDASSQLPPAYTP